MFSINFDIASYMGLSAGLIAHKPILLKMKKQDVATAIETELTLVDQAKDAELEYRVIAIDKSGEDSLSNMVMVVL